MTIIHSDRSMQNIGHLYNITVSRILPYPETWRSTVRFGYSRNIAMFPVGLVSACSYVKCL